MYIYMGRYNDEEQRRSHAGVHVPGSRLTANCMTLLYTNRILILISIKNHTLIDTRYKKAEDSLPYRNRW